MRDIHAARDEHELQRRLAEAEAEVARLQQIISSCQWYWDADDSEYCHSDPWEVVDDLDHGAVAEVWRGGKVETMFVAKVGEELICEPTREAATAKAEALLKEFWSEEDA